MTAPGLCSTAAQPSTASTPAFESAPIVSDIFARMVRQRAFGVAELGLTFYLRTLDDEDPPFAALAAAPNDKALSDMLDDGQIDALISAQVPRCLLEGSPRVARLFTDDESVEREYFARTRIFPIMHTVVIRKELLAQRPGLAQAVYQGFCDAKSFAIQEYAQQRAGHHANVMVPWFGALYDKNSRLLPDDWWPYAIEANRETIDTFLRYFFEQGLSQRRLTLEEKSSHPNCSERSANCYFPRLATV
jgi:hypothetical protein